MYVSARINCGLCTDRHTEDRRFPIARTVVPWKMATFSTLT